jgi:hypothetical protein
MQPRLNAKLSSAVKALLRSPKYQCATALDNCELDYLICGHIAVVSSCVHLHSILFSDDPSELSMARQRLILNFKFLMKLKSSCRPIIDSSVSYSI